MDQPLSSHEHSIDHFIAKVQNGDREAFRNVVEMSIDFVRAFVVARSVPGIEVDDVVQGAYIEAYKNVNNYAIGSDFTSWIVTIAKYRLLMETSRLRRRADYHARYVPYVLAQALESRVHDPAMIEAMRLQFLRECLSQLSESSRRLIEDRYEQNYSMEQLAISYSRTSGAIRKQLSVLRKTLHDCIRRKIALESAS
jgi:RNA polymerase sigma-70 factor, ECF subfamily